MLWGDARACVCALAAAAAVRIVCVCVREMNLSWEIVRFIISFWNIVFVRILLFALCCGAATDIWSIRSLNRASFRDRNAIPCNALIVCASLMNYVVAILERFFFGIFFLSCFILVVEAALFTRIPEIRQFFFFVFRVHAAPAHALYRAFASLWLCDSVGTYWHKSFFNDQNKSNFNWDNFCERRILIQLAPW